MVDPEHMTGMGGFEALGHTGRSTPLGFPRKRVSSEKPLLTLASEFRDQLLFGGYERSYPHVFRVVGPR